MDMPRSPAMYRPTQVITWWAMLRGRYLLFDIVDFRKRSVGGGVFYGPVPNVLGFAYSHCL
jgi:hypothetical protein